MILLNNVLINSKETNMLKKITAFTILACITLIISGCSTPEKKEETVLNEKIKAQEPADTPQHIAVRAAEAFSGAPGLSAEQKMKLHAIYTRVYSESMQIRRDIGQSKSLLFMTLANSDYKSADITRLKKKIVDLDQKRLTLMFDALQDVQKIVGKGIEAEKIYKHLHEHEVPKKYEF